MNKHFIILVVFLFLPHTSHALSIIPNDPYFNIQTYIQSTHIDEAWGYSIGSEDIVIAVIDSGVDIDHPDIKRNIWVNEDEIPGNNIDDDYNGYIDDVNGWNFVEKTNDPNPVFVNFSTPGVSHGTLVAGIIAAEGNNKEGLAGVTWNSKIMPIRVLDSQGTGSLDNATQGIYYAINNGADIINLSFVGQSSSDSFLEAVRYAYKKGLVIVAAVGNDAIGAATYSGGDLDHSPVYPACFQASFEDYVIGVGAIDEMNKKTSFSNFGNTCLDINAVGTNIVSTQVVNQSQGDPFNSEYTGFWDGTSFAAPQVSGVAALIKAVNPKYTNRQIIDAILNTADSLDEYNKDVSGKLGSGKLNARRALRSAAPLTLQPSDPRDKVNLERNNRAIWISDTVPKKILSGDAFSTKFSFKNKGSISWNQSEMSLRITDRNGNTGQFKTYTPNLNNTSDVLPTQTLHWQQLITAPEHPGTYHVIFQLTYRNTPIAGASVYKTFTVLPSQKGTVHHASIPLAVLKKWGSAPVQLTIENNSTEVWNQKTTFVQMVTTDTISFKPGISSSANKLSMQEKSVAPGQKATFSGFIYFQKAQKGVHYYNIMIELNGSTYELQNGDKICRID